MPDFRYVICDVFTDRPLAGNQLAVFTDAREIPERMLQPLAREINFSETVFVYPPEAGGHARIGASDYNRRGSRRGLGHVAETTRIQGQYKATLRQQVSP